jgi:hypothetical protein
MSLPRLPNRSLAKLNRSHPPAVGKSFPHRTDRSRWPEIEEITISPRPGVVKVDSLREVEGRFRQFLLASRRAPPIHPAAFRAGYARRTSARPIGVIGKLWSTCRRQTDS